MTRSCLRSFRRNLSESLTLGPRKLARWEHRGPWQPEQRGSSRLEGGEHAHGQKGWREACLETNHDVTRVSGDASRLLRLEPRDYLVMIRRSEFGNVQKDTLFYQFGCFQLYLPEKCDQTRVKLLWEQTGSCLGKVGRCGRLQTRSNPESKGHGQNLAFLPFHFSSKGGVILNPPAWLRVGC